MTKSISLIPMLSLCAWLVACSKEDIPDDPEPLPKSSFEISVSPVSDKYEIDKPIDFMVTANENMKSVELSIDFPGDTLDNSKALLSMEAPNYLGKTASFSVGFEFPREYTLTVRAENKNQEFSEKQLTIKVEKGNAVKIKGIKVVSFYKRAETWDIENDVFLPDIVRSVLFKDSYGITFNDTQQGWSFSRWFHPQEKNNGQELYWDLSDANLYILPSRRFAFDLGGLKNDGTFIPLRKFPLRYERNKFEKFASTKPESIKIIEDENNLEVIFELEW